VHARWPVLVLLAALLCVAGARAQPAAVTVRLGELLGPVPDLAVSGFNIGNAMQIVGSEEAYARLRLESLRFPPGNQADEIAVGPTDLAALALNLDLLGRPPLLLVTNLFGGTPEQAAQLARLTKELDIEVLAWEIGNEPDLYASNRADPSWTPERYCREFRAYREELLEVDASYRFAGPAASGSRPRGEKYLREVLQRCGDVIDILSWHVYPTDGTWDDESALQTSRQFGEEVRRYRSWVRSPEHNPLGFDRELQLAVTEFGLSWRSASFRHLEDMTATLWLADVLGQMLTERLDLSNYFTIQGMGGHGLIDISGWVRPTFHVYEMLAPFDGQAVVVEVTGDNAGQPPVALGAYAVEDDRTVRLLLVNRGNREVSVEIDAGARTVREDRARLRVLNEEIFDELGAPQDAILPRDAALLVPARGIVTLTIATGDEAEER